MSPTLFSFDLGGRELGLPTYGVLVALGFAVGIVLFWREGKRQGLDGARLLDLAFWGVVAGLVGSRLAFVGLNAGEFIDACFNPGRAGAFAGASSELSARISGCTAVLRFWDGGFVFYGGALATGMVALLFCRREGWSFWRIGDLGAPTLAIGHAIGRLGCFFAGCCFGKGCPARWGISFPQGSVAFDELRSVGVLAPGATFTPPLHATQLYEAAGELAIFVLLLALRRRWRERDTASERESGGRWRTKRPAGGLLLVYVGCYAVLRLFVEMFRGDVSRRFLVEWTWPGFAAALGLPPDAPLFLSVSQFTSLLILAATVGTVLWRHKQLTR